MNIEKAPANSNRRRKGQGRKSAIPMGLCAVALLAVLAWMIPKQRQTQPELKIADYEISEDAYRWAMYKARNEVLSLHSAAGISPVVWDVRTELGLPQEMVADRAVEILKEFYAVGILAVDRGYLRDASFEALQEERQAVNEFNRENIDAGSIVTGLKNYTLERYIDYRTASLRRQFCYDETNLEMSVTEQELRQRYEQDKDQFYAAPDSFILRWIEIPDRPELEAQVDLLRLDALDAGSLKEALENYPELASYLREESFEGQHYATYEREYSLLLSYAGELNTGEFSPVICENGCIWLVECVERKEGGYVDFDSVAAVVRRMIREDRYDALVAELAGQLSVSYDAEALYNYTAELLG